MTTKKEIDGNAADEQSVATPKRRTRIVKKDTDHVYSASQDQGERFDTIAEERTHKRAAAAAAKDEKAAAIHALESEVLVPPKKNRGRPSKAYLEAQRAYEEALARQQTQIDETKAALTSTSLETRSEQDIPTADEDAELVAPELPETLETPQPDADATEPAAEVNDDDDVPEFIKMQRAAATPTEETDVEEEPVASMLSSLAHKDENTNEAETASDQSQEAVSMDPADVPAIAAEVETETVEDNAATDESGLLQRLAQAYAAGQRFIIVDDVPVIDAEGFSFTVPAEDVERVPFRRFKDDMLMEVATDALISTSEKDTATDKLPDALSETGAQAPLRLGEITIEAEGVMDIDAQGVGYLRSADYNYMPSPDDIFVSQNQIRSYSLKTGDVVRCVARIPREGEKYYALKEIISINDCAPHQVRDRIAFEHLTPLFPDEQYKLSKRGEKSPLSCRIVDLFAPIGKGQRALIVAQPKTGKTILMKQIANAIAAHHPESYLIMLLIDERPEEVTDMARTVNAEVIASTFDEPAKRHVRIANIVLEKAKRMVECGKDVVIFLDSITRLARAFNTEAPTSGKILTGGVDANALQKPKRFFGAARNIEGGGSLTIIATALIDTGSKMDEVIFEEFKGTGNMELQLDRGLANKRIFPAVNLVQSSTRREDLLLDELTVNRMFITRNYMADMSPVEAMNFLRKRLETTISNEEFITAIGS